jgi:hypothetical protein
MGLLEQEIYELRNLRRDFRAGKFDAQHINTEIAIYSQTEKRAKLLLQAHVSGAKVKSGLLREIFKTNMIGEGQAIDMGQDDPEEDKVKCYERDELITRAECLDYSGSHIDDCSGCETGKTTKAKLLPPEF